MSGVPSADAQNSSSSSSSSSTTSSQPHNATGRLATAVDASSPAQFARLQATLKSALRQYPDFPSKGILFEDILPIFRDPQLHESLLAALEYHVTTTYPLASSSPHASSTAPATNGTLSLHKKSSVDIVVGLEARGFLFGPALALRLGAGFVPVRKRGKLPGDVASASYAKEYGTDHFEIQRDAIQPGQRVLVVDDIIATGGSAAAAGQLVGDLQGKLVGFVFMLELEFLKGRERLFAPVMGGEGEVQVHTLLTGQS